MLSPVITKIPLFTSSFIQSVFSIWVFHILVHNYMMCTVDIELMHTHTSKEVIFCVFHIAGFFKAILYKGIL